MSFFDLFHFIRPAWLGLLPVVAWIWWLSRKSQDPLGGWRAVMEPELLEALVLESGNRSRWRSVGLLLAWSLAVVAIAGPTWRPEPSPFADDPVPVMLVLRAGESMDQSDLVPSRMERASLKVADFATERKGQPMGLVAYAGSSHLVLPPTRDTDVVATMAGEISPEIMPKQGDDLVGALRIAAKATGDNGGSIVVFADTITDRSEAEIAEFRSECHLPVHFLAIARKGTPELDAIRRIASTLHANVTLMTPDTADVQALVRSTANAPVAIAAADEGSRWAEAGWWFVPIIALFSLISFRRVQNTEQKESLQ